MFGWWMWRQESLLKCFSSISWRLLEFTSEEKRTKVSLASWWTTSNGRSAGRRDWWAFLFYYLITQPFFPAFKPQGSVRLHDLEPDVPVAELSSMLVGHWQAIGRWESLNKPNIWRLLRNLYWRHSQWESRLWVRSPWRRGSSKKLIFYYKKGGNKGCLSNMFNMIFKPLIPEENNWIPSQWYWRTTLNQLICVRDQKLV